MQEFIFKQAEDENWCIIGYQGDETNVLIPSTHWGKPVTILGDALFRGHTEITSVNIPNTVTDLGGFLFDGCSNLHHIDLPDSIENIWQYVFVRSGIEEIALPKKLKYIINFAFKDCKNLKRVVCNENLKEICAWAFEGCTQLTDLVHGPDVKISPKAFESLQSNE